MKKIALTYRYPHKARPYAEAARAAGMEPVLIAPADAPATLDGYVGLLLTGGTDICPSLYGQAPHPLTEAPDRERDDMEIRYLTEALERDLPVLAICRGMQLLNVVHPRGDLRQHIEGHSVRDRDPAEAVHEVRIQEGTRLAKIYSAEAVAVNSRHHQAASSVGKGLRIAALAEDDTIEGLERPDRRFVLGVQWHPEDQIERYPEQRKLFEAFADLL